MGKAKRVLALVLSVMLVCAMVTGCGDSGKESGNTGESKDGVLKGGGSNIIYIITPSHSNPFFKTEAEAASKKAKELGYDVKAVSHDDDSTKQSELFDAAISDKAEIGRAHV